MESINFSPNNLNYITCERCFYLGQKLKIVFKGGFPQIFNTFDLTQKDYFLDKGTAGISKLLPEGKFFKTVTKTTRKERIKNSLPEFNDLEIPGNIKSIELKDNKSRLFTLGGRPDLVVKFKNSFGVLDFKTTGKEDKTQKYKYQLEAYAQIFENPNNETPTLTPITHLGLIQFTPSNIIKHDSKSCTQKIETNYFPLERNNESKAEFLKFMTYLIDILEKNSIPNKSLSCGICNAADEYSKLYNFNES